MMKRALDDGEGACAEPLPKVARGMDAPALPPEIWTHIYGHLPSRAEMLTFSATNRDMHALRPPLRLNGSGIYRAYMYWMNDLYLPLNKRSYKPSTIDPNWLADCLQDLRISRDNVVLDEQFFADLQGV